jgi:hypothetical protein
MPSVQELRRNNRRDAGKEVQSMLKFKRSLAFLTVPAVLAIGVVTYGSVVAASPPNPSPAPSSATEPAEPAEPTTAAEAAAEANEPALPGGGYADADNVQADTQQERVN